MAGQVSLCVGELEKHLRQVDLLYNYEPSNKFGAYVQVATALHFVYLSRKYKVWTEKLRHFHAWSMST